MNGNWLRNEIYLKSLFMSYFVGFGWFLMVLLSCPCPSHLCCTAFPFVLCVGVLWWMTDYSCFFSLYICISLKAIYCKQTKLKWYIWSNLLWLGNQSVFNRNVLLHKNSYFVKLRFSYFDKFVSGNIHEFLSAINSYGVFYTYLMKPNILLNIF